jgi:hypothetical protein
VDSLLTDGLVEQTIDGLFALAGEGDDAGRQAPAEEPSIETLKVVNPDRRSAW